MAREHIISIWCDPCMELDDIKEEGKETPPISLGNQKPRVLALCKQHWVDFYEPLEEFVAKFGVPLERLVGAPTPKKAPAGVKGNAHTGVELPNGYRLPKGIPASRADEYRVVCPTDCKELQRSAATMSNHLRAAHDMSLYEAIGPEGQLFDLDGVSVPTPKPRQRVESEQPQRAVCDVPGCDKGPDGGPAVYEQPKNRLPIQALGVHKAKAHGIRGAGKAKKK